MRIVCVWGVVLLTILAYLTSLAAASLRGEQIGLERGRAEERQKAIEAGVGRWTIDPATGERQFTYNPTSAD